MKRWLHINSAFMIKSKNIIVLNPGDQLYRYGIGDHFPNQWDIDVHSVEYRDDKLGYKNQIGALFFYDNERTALNVLSSAINRQKDKGIIIEDAIISTATVIEEITLLDLESGISRCTQMLSCLYDLGIDVMTDEFRSHQRNESFGSIRERFHELYSDDWNARMSSAKIIDDFFFNLPPLLGQSLTDFDNGPKFKRLLEEHQYEGYVFMEEYSSNTYCIFSSQKLSCPTHRHVAIIDEIDDLLE